jgi:hypothetical protein
METTTDTVVTFAAVARIQQWHKTDTKHQNFSDIQVHGFIASCNECLTIQKRQFFYVTKIKFL